MWAERTSTPMCGNSARMMRAACRPSSEWSGGMRTSISTTSGRCARTLRSRSSRSPAWPATSKPDSSSRRAVPARSRTESSPMTTRRGSSTPGSSRRARVSNCVTGGYMPPKLRLDGRARNRRDGWVYRRGELGAGLDAQLLVDLREVPLDRLGADEQLAGGLLVGAPGGDQLGHALLGGRQRAGGRGAPADPGELCPRPRRPQRRAERLEAVERLLQRRAGSAPLARAALARAEDEQQARALERLPAGAVHLRRLAAQEIDARRHAAHPRAHAIDLQLDRTSAQHVRLDRVGVPAKQRRLAQPGALDARPQLV